MLSIENLNKHTYPGTKFYEHKNNPDKILIDLNISINGKKIKPIILGNVNEILSEDFQIRHTSPDKITSLFNFTTKSSVKNIEKFIKEQNKYEKKIIKVASFIDNIPPVVNSDKGKNNNFTIISDSTIVNSNIEKLNKYFINFINEIAQGKRDKKSKINHDEVDTILNKRTKFSHFFMQRDNRVSLYEKSYHCAQSFNSYLTRIVKNDNFLAFIKENPDKNVGELTEIANKIIEGEKSNKKNLLLMKKTFDHSTKTLATNILELAINKAYKGPKTLDILNSLILDKQKRKSIA